MKTPYKLLIVDDEPDLLETLHETLEKNIPQIATASDGRRALDLIQSDPSIVAILSDINMPVMNGLDLLKSLRSSDNPIPFVFLTGYADKDKAVEALRLGAFDFLEKPFERTLLRETVGRAYRFGVDIQTLSAEVEALARRYQIPDDQMEAFRKAQRELLIISKQNKIYGSKAS